MGKNIVILCDGTGQIGGQGAATNVYKLFNMLEDRTPHQVVYYDPGIGSFRFGLPAQIFGIGFKQNILDCYNFIFENYEAGDDIYLFGFSRGAATVRSLSAFIELFGILPGSRGDLIEKAFKIYEMKSDHEEEALMQWNKRTMWNEREMAAKAFVAKHHTMWTRIRFIGVWDTVAALGGTGKILNMITDTLFPHKFHTFCLSPGVDYARHAISIDDERKTFHPIIWQEDPDKERLKQVWFCGVHTDVGGGYDDGSLSFYSFDWMVREAEPKGLRFYKHSPGWKKYIDDKAREAASHEPVLVNGTMHNEQEGFVGGLYRREPRSWDPKKFGKITIHKSVFSRTKNNMNKQDPNYKSQSWILKIEDHNVEN